MTKGESTAQSIWEEGGGEGSGGGAEKESEVEGSLGGEFLFLCS